MDPSSGSVDPGPSGFLGIFGSGADSGSDDTQYDESSSPDATTTADTESPEAYTSADDVVAARFAASLEADGYELASDDEEADTSDEGFDTSNLDDLTVEQLRSLAEEAVELRSRVTQADQQMVVDRVRMAEQAAVQEVQRAFEVHVLQRSAAHYRREYNERMKLILDASKSANNPDAYVAQAADRLTESVTRARLKWEAEQQAQYDAYALQRALQARKQVPELRQMYAQELTQEFGLPAQAAQELLRVREIDDFRTRAEEIASIRDMMAEREQRNAATRRQDANQRLRENPMRTSATGRPRGGAIPAYRGTADEGVRILGLMHKQR
jgi:hypothetical protein